LILAEAAAFGLPAVAFAIGGATEVIVGGETGVLVPVGDVAALAAALRRLLDPVERRRLGTAARSRAERVFTIDRVMDAYREVYNGISRG
jgi:glycosyltransferase involved in cell wall biosynthesis